MVEKDVYDGFTPDKKPEYIIQGCGIAFFATSCILAFTLLPSLFATEAFAQSQRSAYASMTNQEMGEIIKVIAIHISWMLGSFIVTQYIFHRRRAGIVWALLLLGCGIGFFGAMPFVEAGNILLICIWGLATLLLTIYRREFE